MLEMIRQYAHQRLLERDESRRMREGHLDYYLALSLQAEQHLRAKSSRAWRERLEAEIDNLRLALEWSLSGSIEKGLRLAAALQWFWAGSRHRIEGVGWLNRLLAAGSGEDSSKIRHPTGTIAYKIARGKALNASSYIGTLDRAGWAAAWRLKPRPFSGRWAICDPKDLAYSIYLSKEKGLLECLEMFRKIGDPFFIAEMLLFLTQAARWRGELGAG